MHVTFNRAIFGKNLLYYGSSLFLFGPITPIIVKIYKYYAENEDEDDDRSSVKRLVSKKTITIKRRKK
jgi:hypothetical protein